MPKDYILIRVRYLLSNNYQASNDKEFLATICVNCKCLSINYSIFSVASVVTIV